MCGDRCRQRPVSSRRRARFSEPPRMSAREKSLQNRPENRKRAECSRTPFCRRRPSQHARHHETRQSAFRTPGLPAPAHLRPARTPASPLVWILKRTARRSVGWRESLRSDLGVLGQKCQFIGGLLASCIFIETLDPFPMIGQAEIISPPRRAAIKTGIRGTEQKLHFVGSKIRVVKGQGIPVEFLQIGFGNQRSELLEDRRSGVRGESLEQRTGAVEVDCILNRGTDTVDGVVQETKNIK